MTPTSPTIATARGLATTETADLLHPSLTQRRIETPTLNIMLGSTPALAALEVYQHLQYHNQRDRDRVCFLFIDTDDVPLEMQDYRRTNKGIMHEINLRISVPPGVEYAQMPEYWTHTFVPTKIPKYYANGAGGIRNNGHVAAAFNHERLQASIDQGINVITTLGNTDDERRAAEVQVNIVAFLGGGTGSGILSDVAAIARNLLTKYALAQRINIFCLLPERIGGSTNVNISWRKSNAVATLLELTALSVAAKERGLTTSADQVKKIYRKYLLHDSVDISDQNPLANEVYLIGRTLLGTANDTARLVGLDLYMRIVDGSGVGWTEHSKWVDRQGLMQSDERLLPRFYGTTCPLMLYFPAHDTAAAFAQISAARLLRLLVPAEAPRLDPPDAYIKEQWERAWETVGETADNIDPNSDIDAYRVNALEFFTVQDFEYTPYALLLQKKQDYEGRLRAFDTELRFVIAKVKRDQEQRIDNPAALPPDETDVPIIGARITHLQQLQQEYAHILATLQADEITDPSSNLWLESDIDQLISRLAEAPALWGFPLPSAIAGPQETRRKEALVRTLNDNLNNYPVFQRRKLLMDLLGHLSRQVEAALNREAEWFTSNFLGEDIERLKRLGYGSASWKGMLTLPHPHMFHVFDHPTLRNHEQTRNLAVEQLYFQTTMRASLEIGEIAPGDDTLDTFPPATRQMFINGSKRYLALRDQQDQEDLRDHQLNATDLAEFGKQRLAERVVEYLTDYYLEAVRDRNLFDLLRMGAGRGRVDLVSTILFDHVNRMKDLVGELIVQEVSLHKGGPQGMDQSLYVGANFGAGTRDVQLLQAQLDALGPFTRDELRPVVKSLDDPHQLQMSYGLHGISLSTIPEFYRANDSMMGEFLKHQASWMNREIDATLNLAAEQRWPGYGNNDQPAVSCGELEYLVCDANALRYPDTAPYATDFGPSLVGRVIRDVQAPGGGNRTNGSTRRPPPFDPNGYPGSGSPPDPYDDLPSYRR